MDEPELVSQLKKQDEKAFYVAIETYSPAMLYTARTMLDAAAAEDIVQDTWLTVISANKAKNWLRKHRRESLLDDFEPLERAMESRFNAGGGWSVPFAGEASNSPETITESSVLRGCIDKHLALMRQQ
ncbi:MAG: RNA polymerase sigma factor [Marinobacter sp.]